MFESRCRLEDIISLTLVFLLLAVGEAFAATPQISSMNFSSKTPIGGVEAKLTGTVGLTAPAPTGGMILSVVASSPAVTFLKSASGAAPGTVSIAAGQLSGVFGFEVSPVSSDTPVTVTASHKESAPLKGGFTIKAPVLTSLTFVSPSVAGGNFHKGTARLTGPAATEIAMSVTSSSTAVKVSSPLGFGVGQSSRTFDVVTSVVTVDTPVTVKITSPNGLSVSSNFTVLAPAVLKSLSFAAPTVAGGKTARATATINAPVQVRTTVPVTSSNGAVSVPASIEFPAGQTSVSFDVTASAVTADTPVTVKLTSASGATVSADLTVTPPPPVLVSISTLSPVASTDDVVVKFTLDRIPSAPFTATTTSSNPSALPFPATTTLTPGFFGPVPDSFSIRAGDHPTVTVDTPVTITGTVGGVTKSITVTLAPVALVFTGTPTTIVGGSNSRGSVGLNISRDQFTTVKFVSNSGAVSVPSEISLPSARFPGDAPPAAAFDIFAQAVSAPTRVTITATAPGIPPKDLFLTVNPAVLSVASVALSAARCDLSRDCQSSYTGTVTLDAPAPSEGLSVSLSSDRPSSLSVPNVVLVQGGATSATFGASLPFSTASSGTVRISAVSGSSSPKNLTFEIVKTFNEVQTLTLNSSETTGGTAITGTVTVREAVASGSTTTTVSPTTFDTSVQLSAETSQGGAGLGTFSNAVITIPKGQSSGTFTFTPQAVSATKSIDIRATARGTLGSGALSTAILTVQPATIQSLSLAQPSVQGGQPVAGTVRMSGAVPFSNSVEVTSSNPAVATIVAPSFPTGSSSATFEVRTSSDVAQQTPVTVTATFNGQSTTTDLTVNRRSILSGVTLPSARVFGGIPTSVRVQLDGPAPRNAVVTLSDASSQFRFFPNQVTVPEGRDSLVVQSTPGSPGNPQQAFISASYLEQSKSAQVTVEPLFVDICNSLPREVRGGTTITCSVAISTQGMVAPDGGMQLPVTSSNGGLLSAPSTLSFSGGAREATLTMSTQPVTVPTDVDISIVIGERSSTRTFTIIP